jgi:hypothetical protein
MRLGSTATRGGRHPRRQCHRRFRDRYSLSSQAARGLAPDGTKARHRRPQDRYTLAHANPRAAARARLCLPPRRLAIGSTRCFPLCSDSALAFAKMRFNRASPTCRVEPLPSTCCARSAAQPEGSSPGSRRFAAKHQPNVNAKASTPTSKNLICNVRSTIGPGCLIS